MQIQQHCAKADRTTIRTYSKKKKKYKKLWYNGTSWNESVE